MGLKKASKKSRCPCGSGRRYESCCRIEHVRTKALFADLAKKIETDTRQREAYAKRYGHARRPVGVEMNGKMWVAIDGAIYQQVQDGPYNFVNAIHDHALHFFGEDVLETEESMPLHLRHPAIQWMHCYLDAISKFGDSHQDGNGAAWFRFAYDLYTIRDNAKLQDDLRNRLLSPKTFQAARYELKVAAICSTAGFDLQFEDESDNSRRHPEFVGTDRLSGSKIAVEAKSRHRKGVLGFSGGIDQAPGSSVGVRKNILEAYKKQPEFPFYVFIDTNLPAADAPTMRRWEGELEQVLLDLEAEGYSNPCPANAVFFTNDPSHYVGSGLIGGSEDFLWVRCFTPPEPSIPHPNDELVERLLMAHKQRVAPPADFHENP